MRIDYGKRECGWPVLRVKPETRDVARYMAAYLGLSVGRLLDMAVREFAARRLPDGWEEEAIADDTHTEGSEEVQQED